MQRMHAYNFWVVVRKAPDVPGQWIAHCLDLDLVTQGDSLPHVMKMLEEATWMTLADDLGRRRDPLLRRGPQECWDELWSIVQKGQRVDYATVLNKPAGQPGPFVAHVAVTVTAVPRAKPSAGTATRRKVGAGAGHARSVAGPAASKRFEPELAFAAAGA